MSVASASAAPGERTPWRTLQPDGTSRGSLARGGALASPMALASSTTAASSTVPASAKSCGGTPSTSRRHSIHAAAQVWATSAGASQRTSSVTSVNAIAAENGASASGERISAGRSGKPGVHVHSAPAPYARLADEMSGCVSSKLSPPSSDRKMPRASSPIHTTPAFAGSSARPPKKLTASTSRHGPLAWSARSTFTPTP